MTASISKCKVSCSMVSTMQQGAAAPRKYCLLRIYTNGSQTARLAKRGETMAALCFRSEFAVVAGGEMSRVQILLHF